jgi:signal peptidase II
MRLLFSISGIVLILDQVTKFLAIWLLKPKGSVPVVRGIFHLSYVENTGIAFGFLQNYPRILAYLIAASVICLLAVSWWFKNRNRTERLAYGFILGGATGNLIDRVRFQNVIDFLDFRVWPVFNFADSFITIGVFLFIYLAFLRKN